MSKYRVIAVALKNENDEVEGYVPQIESDKGLLQGAAFHDFSCGNPPQMWESPEAAMTAYESATPWQGQVNYEWQKLKRMMS